MPEAIVPQAELPLAPPTATPGRFVMPEDPVVVAPTGVPAESEPKPAQDNEKQAPSTIPEGEKPEEVTPEQAAKREGRRFERRLDKAYRERAEARARAEFLERQVAELQQPKAPPGRPTQEQFDYDPEKYATAVADFEKKEALEKFQKESESRQQTEANNKASSELVASWEEKVAAAEEKYDDLDEKIVSLKPDTSLSFTLMNSEHGVEIARYLLANPKEDARIGKLHPLVGALAIGRLEAKLLASPVQPKTPSKAPAPIKTLTGTAPVVNDAPSEEDDLGVWMKKRNKQVHGRH